MVLQRYREATAGFADGLHVAWATGMAVLRTGIVNLPDDEALRIIRTARGSDPRGKAAHCAALNTANGCGCSRRVSIEGRKLDSSVAIAQQHGSGGGPRPVRPSATESSLRQDRPDGRSLHWLIRMNHRHRVVLCLALIVLLSWHLHDVGAPAWTYGVLWSQMLVLPHVYFQVTRRAADPQASDAAFMRVDAAMLGAWLGALHFPLWITVAGLASVTLHPMVLFGPRGFISCLLVAAGTAGAAAIALPWSPATGTSAVVTGLCVGYLAVYLIGLTFMAYHYSAIATKLRLDLKASREALQHRLEEVESLQGQLRDQAQRDPLTGLYNRRFLEPFLAHELARARRERNALSVALLDIDHFKSINDRHGHPAGDHVIRDVAGRIGRVVRASDVTCRFGGEEYLIVLPQAATEGVVELAERLRLACEREPSVFEGQDIALTVSIGVTTLQPEDADPSALLHRVDRALYAAKVGGRNRVVSAP